MPEVRVDLEVLCECGAELVIEQNKWAGSITVQACEDCLNASYEEGKSDLQEEIGRD